MKKYRASDSLAFTGALIFGICGFVFVLVSISEGTFYKALWVHAIYFSLVVLYYFGAKFGTYITVTSEKIRGTVFFLPGKITYIEKIVSLEEEANFGGQINQIFMNVRLANEREVRRGLTSKEMLSKEDLSDFISEIKRLNPSIIIPKSLLK